MDLLSYTCMLVGKELRYANTLSDNTHLFEYLNGVSSARIAAMGQQWRVN